ncbi:hypothetical protein ACOACO_17595 [Nocardioides sp. CPCC 205120]|uniref:hypothetical protein n=1 Tax=Nocardioides sp. CPCC 205120 TaxID=3406462 RepID=UPI003B509418
MAEIRPCWGGGNGCAGPVRTFKDGPACELVHSPAALAGRTVPVPDPAVTMAGLLAAAAAAREAASAPLAAPEPIPAPATDPFVGRGAQRTYDGRPGRLFTGEQVDQLRVRKAMARVGGEIREERAAARSARRAERVMS